MTEPFKNVFNPDMITLMAAHLKNADPTFNSDLFVAKATDNLDALELKQRSTHICHALEATLAADYRTNCQTMLNALHPLSDIDLSQTTMDTGGIRGWAIMPMGDFVARSGLVDFEFSLGVLKEFTKRFSAEFAIRDFFITDANRTLKIVQTWTDDPNYHVRRLASEGSRPRLPWAKGLPEFAIDPTPLIPLLDALKDDPTEYVRRSVANNLNDIAKDHPDLVAKTVTKWMKGANKDRHRLLKHACRTLIKQGHKPTLQAFGYTKPNVSLQHINLHTPQLKLGNHLEFSISLTSNSNQTQPLIIDFIIHHQKSNGTTSPKVFKWKTLELPAGKTLNMTKKHMMKPITTRVYYAGLHHLEIQINGDSFGRVDFELTL